MMKKVLCCLLALSLLFTTFVVSFAEEPTNVMKEFYVSVDGDDNGDGSQANPFKTVDRARLEVQKYNDNMTGNIVVNIADGRYELDDYLVFGVEDSGSNGYDVIYKGERDANVPTLSGGVQITGWTDNGDGTWSAKVDNEEIDFIRDIYVNDYQGQRARNTKLTYGEGAYDDPNTSYTLDGFYVNKGKFAKWDNIEDVDLSWGVAWKSFTIDVEDVIDDPTNPDRYIVLMDNPLWSSGISGAAKTTYLPQQPYWYVGFQIENAYELMDEPGEFYFNKKTRVLHYIPREGQDMNTAEVIVPKLERVIRFYGNRPEDKVHNIKLQDLRFAHTNFWPYEYQYQHSDQGDRPGMPGAPARHTPGGVQLDWADSIDIESCVFYGIETVGLHPRKGATNCKFEGNVFTEIGSGAFVVGLISQTRFKNGNNDSAPLNLMGDDLRAHMSAIRWNQHINDGTNVWRGNVNAAEDGILDYVWLDFDEPYNLDTMKIDFSDREKQEITDEEQSNFEVLVSNDENFETYTTVAVVRGKADDVLVLDPPKDQKYRYMLIRKIVPEQFAIRSITVTTKDKNAISDTGTCSYLSFENNYVQRPAKRHYAAPGVATYFCNYVNIDHNEIYDTPYSAMSLGFLWNPGERFETSHHVTASYNHIERYHLFCNDGGGIYTLACQPDSGLTYNYLLHCGNTWGGIYHDSSSGDYHDHDNVMEYTPYAFFNNGGSVQNLNIYNNFSDGKDRSDSTTGSKYEAVKINMPGFIPAEAMKIKNEAGLTSEWDYIRERVPEGDLTFPQGSIDEQASYIQGASNPLEASEYRDFAKHYFDTVLKKGTWGLLPWNYDITKKDELAYWNDRWTSNLANYEGDWNTGHGSAFDMYEAREIYEQVYYGVEHLSFEDMKKLCDDTIANASTAKEIGGYPAASIEKFKKDYAAALKMPQAEEHEKYGVVLELEKAYQALYDAQYRAAIDYLYVEGGLTEMDYENKAVTVTVGANCDLNTIAPVFTLSNNTKLGANLSTMTYNKPMKLALYNSEIGKYDYWTLTIKGASLEPTGVTSPSLEVADWHDTNPNSPIAKVGNDLVFNSWYKAYTDKADVFDGEVTFKTKIMESDNVEGIHFLVSAQTGDNLEYAAYYEKNTYYDVAFKGQKIEVSSVKAGKSKLCFTVDNIGFNYGEYNDVSIKINDSGKLDTVSVMVNGRAVAHNAYADDIGAKGYFGIKNANQTVRISK